MVSTTYYGLKIIWVEDFTPFFKFFINLPAGNKVGSETEDGAAINKITTNLT